jgi:hypothetical protein
VIVRVSSLHTTLLTVTFSPRSDSLRCPEWIPNDFSFDSSIENVEGEEKQKLVEFMKKMVCWVPEERSSASELLITPWILSASDELSKTKTRWAKRNPGMENKIKNHIVGSRSQQRASIIAKFQGPPEE